MSEPITARQFHQAAGVEDWRVVAGGAGAYFRTGSFAASARFVQAIGELASVPLLGSHSTGWDATY